MAMSQFYSTQQRFFSLLLTSLKVPTAVREAEKALADGKAVAITLINTNEAAQSREKNRVAAEDVLEVDFLVEVLEVVQAHDRRRVGRGLNRRSV